MVNIRFVFTDGADNFLMNEEYIKTAQTDDISITTQYFARNSDSLGRVFNYVLDDIRNKNTQVDYVAFIHGDVRFDVKEFVNRLIAMNNKYDLVGLAGTKKLDMSVSPLNWFTGSSKTPESRYGDITMITQDGDRRCEYNKINGIDVSDTEVACIDGLCIVFNRKMLESNIKFNEDMMFNCYDTYISLSAIMKYHFKVGVMVLPTIHQSVGKSILSDVFMQDENILRSNFILE